MTAVEFVLNLVIGVDPQGKDVRVKDSLTVDEIKQAKEMEKEQIVMAIDYIYFDEDGNEMTGEDYYNETFKSE